MRAAIPALCTLIALGAAAGCKSNETPVEIQFQSPVATAASDLAATTPTPAKAPDAAWLDPPFVNWNAPGQQVPKAPQITVDDATKERCKVQNRPPACDEDRAVAAAGWTLFGPLQTFGKATMISGMATVDVGCRPVSMQTFVFLDGKFAGTVSPKPMESRTDGAQRLAFLTGEDFLFGEFARFAPADELCCPSRFATVTFRIESQPEGPVLVPLQVNHQDAPQKKKS